MRERTLSIHTVVTGRRERFYWLAVLFTCALGTAGGDLLAEQVGLGYLASTGLFAAAIAAIWAAHLRGRLGAIGAFWAAYVLTRPLGHPSATSSPSRVQPAGSPSARSPPASSSWARS